MVTTASFRFVAQQVKDFEETHQALIEQIALMVEATEQDMLTVSRVIEREQELDITPGKPPSIAYTTLKQQLVAELGRHHQTLIAMVVNLATTAAMEKKYNNRPIIASGKVPT